MVSHGRHARVGEDALKGITALCERAGGENVAVEPRAKTPRAQQQGQHGDDGDEHA